MVRIANTATLKKLLAKAGREVPPGLDPVGVHVLSDVMMHNDADVRCRVLVKITDTMEPFELLLDVPPADWDRLTVAALV